MCESYAERQMFCKLQDAKSGAKGVWEEPCVSMLGVAEMLQRYAVRKKGVVVWQDATRNAMLKSKCLCREVAGTCCGMDKPAGPREGLRKLTRCRSRALSVRVSLAETWTWSPSY